MANESKEIVAHIVHLLEEVKRRPGMWFYPMEPTMLINFLHGFTAGCHVAGHVGFDRVRESIYQQICTENGWKVSSLGPTFEMEERGWDHQRIIEEILTIEIEAWKRTYGID